LDEPLLEGYSFSILNCENGVPLSGWKSLTGAGVKEEIKRLSPSAILLTGLNYRFDFVVYLEAKRRRIPIWLRSESQDHAFNRSKLKSLLRSWFYKIAYAGIKKFFYIGELNRLHYLSHGVQPSKLAEAHYCTVDRFKALDSTFKKQLRIDARKNAAIESSRLVVGFAGKFIPKKIHGYCIKCFRIYPGSYWKDSRYTLLVVASWKKN
jgi:glycosyltransferase involved in cell wall biosynthesis